MRSRQAAGVAQARYTPNRAVELPLDGNDSSGTAAAQARYTTIPAHLRWAMDQPMSANRLARLPTSSASALLALPCSAR